MNALRIFENPEFGKIRTVEVDGFPWLVGKDVAQALGYQNTNKAMADHVDDEDKMQGDGVTIRAPPWKEATSHHHQRERPLLFGDVQQASHGPEIQALGNQ